MRNKFFLLIVSLIFSSAYSFAQDEKCNIKSVVHPDGSMFYYVAMDTFYFNQTKQLMGGMITDKEHYFLTLEPKPSPDKVKKLKDYKPLSVRLANDSTYTLDFFDARFIQDSIYVVMYMFNPKKDKAFLNYGVESVTMKTPFQSETYYFKLHKNAIIRHLKCLTANKNGL